MKARIGIRLAALLTALTILELTTYADRVHAQHPEPDPKVVERPEWSVGDWWEFRENGPTRWRVTVVGKESDQYILARTMAGEPASNVATQTKLYADRDGWVSRIVHGDGRTTEKGDKREYVRFPLSIGKRWFFNIDTRSTGGVPTAYTYDCKAEAWETIEVGQRRVRALRIACGSTNRSNAATFSHAGWYAPEAKRLVRFVSYYAGGPNLDVSAWHVQMGGAVVASAPAPPPGTPQPGVPPRAAPSPAPSPRRESAPPPVPVPAPSPPVAAGVPVDSEAPKIAINYPAPDTKVDRDDIMLLGLVTDNVGVAGVQVTLNGIAIAKPPDIFAAPRSVPIRVPVKLLPGENVIEITATDKAGNAAQVVRTVTRVVPAATAAPPTGPKLGDRWAVVIGAGKYDSADIPKLRYTVSDAESVYQVLTAQGGFKKEHVLLLTDKTERKPTLRNIRWALGTFLSRSAQKDDVVMIFFAGHGAPETDPRGMERDGLAKYLIPSDADPDDLYSSALPMDELQTIFARIEAERVVVFLDACYSGAAGGRTFITKRTRSGQVDDLFLERLTRSKGRAIITASRPAEVSLELPELGHGIFTYYLVQGLQGAADLNRDGIVTVQELYEYLAQQVTQKSRSVGGNQHPIMKGELEGMLPLVKARSR
jgi:uncharacterized caspase-like protein